MRYLDCIFLFYPSIRSLAYLDEFITNDCLPKYIIWMGDCSNLVPIEIRQAWSQFQYAHYFDLDISLEALRENADIQNFYIDSTDINSSELGSLLIKIACKKLVFSGGGIVKQSTLTRSEKNWLHIHPGIVPNYKGSTCFYYSYLQEKQVGCSAFYLTEQLDRGDVLVKCHFEINYPLASNENYFLDYVLDPYVRKKTLGRLLFTEKESDITTSSQLQCDFDDYYVIHPLLRKLCAEKVAKDYLKSKQQGIFLKD